MTFKVLYNPNQSLILYLHFTETNCRFFRRKWEFPLHPSAGFDAAWGFYFLPLIPWAKADLCLGLRQVCVSNTECQPCRL